MRSRREFLTRASATAFAATLPAVPSSKTSELPIVFPCGEEVDLGGDWWFRLDPEKAGEAGNWYAPEFSSGDWSRLVVPHTWQVEPGSEEYRGVAWYRRVFDARTEWTDKAVRLEFEAVFHSATVWMNGKLAGKHLRKGYTAFTLDVTSLLHLRRENVLAVMVSNSFDESMLPRGRSSDWAHDGGIYRSVRLLITPRVFLEGVAVDAVPDRDANAAALEITAAVRNTTEQTWRGHLGFRVEEEDSGHTVLQESRVVPVTIKSGESRPLQIPAATLPQPKLWHFDQPNLYKLTVSLTGRDDVRHELATTFGLRSIEVRDGGFLLNGERVRLMGVERMAGSNPEFGMAEPTGWIVHDHDDLKQLNCVFTRVHWQQDRRVLDYCDRHGILIQSEVPTWGPDTFKGTGTEPDPAIMQNGLEQLQEMIERDRNHPCIFSWGLCNEIGGQNPPAYQFAKRMYQEAKKLNPRRLCSYASNSLQKTPSKDVSGLMDFIEWNEYYESWYGGTPEDLRRNLGEIHEAFPAKPVVISEYGYCACTPDRPEGDVRRREVLISHTNVAREMDYVGGLIFFCYNDYRTHIGDKGVGAARQRIHGVVDLYGARKPSYEVLRQESSPVESFTVAGRPGAFVITVRARNTVPAYKLAGYKLRGVLYGYGAIPLERREAPLPTLTPGQEGTVKLQFSEQGPLWVDFDVLRPTGFSAYRRQWRP